MNEEEKQAIEFLKKELEDEKDGYLDYKELNGLYGNYEIEIILNLIYKQQKEIEKLKSKKYILNAETNEIKEIPISDDYISKDKIRKLKGFVHKTLDDNGITRGYQLTIDNYFKELLGE